MELVAEASGVGHLDQMERPIQARNTNLHQMEGGSIKIKMVKSIKSLLDLTRIEVDDAKC